MARSPYQGTFRPGVQPTVVTAPDALVYINGESDLLGCPQCSRKIDLNKYITSIQVDLNIDSPPGSASISLSVPRHTIDDFYFDGNIILSPMMEVEIYAKGYYLVEGVPQYYPIFWGLITEVSESYSGGEHTIAISCSDILKWWELCKMNINAAFTQPAGQQGRSIFGNVFFGTNPYDVIWTLAQQSFGDIVVASGSLNSSNREAEQKQTFNAALSDIMAYWEKRFTRIRSNLLLYGANGTAVRGDTLYDLYAGGAKNKNAKNFASQAVRVANGGDNSSQMIYDPTSPEVVAFRTQFQNAGQINFWQSEYQTKLELATAAKDSIGFEFYMDVDGSIVFKPPFFNLDVLPNKPISWIQDIDVIDWDFSESESEVVTQLQIQGSWKGGTDYGVGEELTPYTSVTDYHLLRKYGWRTQTFNSEFMGDDLPKMFYVGMDLLDRYNARRHRGTVNIPLRPELRLGFPVYVSSKDQIWYVQGISHNISFGGRAQTTLTLTAKRQKFLAPKGIGTLSITGAAIKGVNTDLNSQKVGELKPAEALSPQNIAGKTNKDLTTNTWYKLEIGEAAQLPPSLPDQKQLQSGDNPFQPLILRHPKTGRIVGYPNVVMAYTRPFTDINQAQKNAGQDPKKAAEYAKRRQEQNDAALAQTVSLLEAHTFEPQDRVREKLSYKRYSYGLTSAGVYSYFFDSSKKVQELLMPPKSRVVSVVQGQVDPEALSQKGSAMIRPVSDERGFEVIGHFRYGRGVYLRDGQLILSEGKNETARVDTQVALSGGLFGMLEAQSQGVSVLSASFTNPVDAISNLIPEDLQTAGRQIPETKQAEFLEQQKVIAEYAPLGSLAQKGLPPSVEASQLSMALTLAELTVKEAVIPNEECICLLGRSELAFINSGYQVKSLFNSSTQPDTSVLPTTQSIQVGPTTTSIKALEHEKELLQGQLDNDIQVTLDPNLKARLEAQIRQINSQITAAQAVDTQDGHRPIVNYALTNSGGALASKIESFLVNLYSALDADHQQYEQGLRGELLPQSPINPDDVRFGNGFNPQTLPSFTPPFNAPNRAQGGDPIALALAANSAVNDIEKTWSDFGDQLQANSKRAGLEQQIRNDQQNLNRAQAELSRLQALEGNGTLVPGNVPAQIKDVEKRIADLEQNIAKNRAKADALPTS